VQWRASTAWHDLDEAEPYAPDGVPMGRFYVADGGTLDGLPDHSFDIVMSSHVIEHFANPLRAIEAWRRVLVDGGWVLMVAPHVAGTFDHRRPVTPLAHLIGDRNGDTGEDDLTHLEETISLHDRGRDSDPSDEEGWAAARRDNLNTRLLHHHVFDGEGLLLMLNEAQLQIEQVIVRHPHDTFVLARFLPGGARPDNTAALASDAEWRRRSPFAVDRRR
jgi:SAM-dependent methyltransferase